MNLKGHDNEADFLGFLQKWFLIDPLHYLSSSAFGFKFAESEKLQLGKSGSR
jgi:hypothetical protein